MRVDQSRGVHDAVYNKSRRDRKKVKETSSRKLKYTGILYPRDVEKNYSVYYMFGIGEPRSQEGCQDNCVLMVDYN